MSWLEKVCSTVPQLSDPHYSYRRWFHRDEPLTNAMKQNETSSEPAKRQKLGQLASEISLISFQSQQHIARTVMKWPFSFARHTVVALSFATVPPPAWFCSTHVDRRPLSNGAVVTPAKKETKTDLLNLLSAKQHAHMHNGERHRQDFQICSNAKSKTTSTHKQKIQGKITSKDWPTQIKKWGTTSKKQWDRLEFTLFYHLMPAFSRSQLSTSASVNEWGGWM